MIRGNGLEKNGGGVERAEIGRDADSVWGEGKCDGKVTGRRSEEKYSELVFLDWNLFCYFFFFLVHFGLVGRRCGVQFWGAFVFL